jgi:DUF2950 family protein
MTSFEPTTKNSTDRPKDPRRGAGPLLVILVLAAGALGGGLFAWWLPKRAQERRWANERNAAVLLKVLAFAESELRASDRDGNGVHDFWTADVARLNRWGLIDRATAEADLRPLVPLVETPIPKDGYYFMALEWDDSEDPPLRYHQITDAASGPVHHRSRFGFIAVPAEYKRTGSHTYAINQNNSLFKKWSEWKGDLHGPSDGEPVTWWSRAG